MFIIAIIVKINRNPSINENLFLFLRKADIFLDMKQENAPNKTTKQKNQDICTAPIDIACRQFSSDAKNMPNAHVDVASNGLQPRLRYMGTRNMPPPNPKPLNMPAPTLISTSYLMCSSKLATLDLLLPTASGSVIQVLKIWMFLQAYSSVNTNEKMNRAQYAAEQGCSPMIDGNFEDPRKKESATVISDKTATFLSMKTVLSSLKGQATDSQCRFSTLSPCSRISWLYLANSVAKRVQIFLTEIRNTAMMMEQVIILGNSLLSSMPMNEPANTIGIETNMRLNFTNGSPLQALNTKLRIFPAAPPSTHEKTTKLASLGKYQKKVIKITKPIEPPPTPARVQKLFTTPMITEPSRKVIVGGHSEWKQYPFIILYPSGHINVSLISIQLNLLLNQEIKNHNLIAYAQLRLY